MIVSSVFLFFAFVILLIYLVKCSAYIVYKYKIIIKLPGPTEKNYIVGNIAYFGTTRESAFEGMRKAAKVFYPIYQVHALNFFSSNIVTPDDAQLILTNSKQNKKALDYVFLQPWLNSGLVNSDSSKWQTRRKILTPAFHFNILQDYVAIINKHCNMFVQDLKLQCQKEWVDVVPYIENFTMKTIVEVVSGKELHFKDEKEILYRKAFHDIGVIIAHRVLHPWLFHKIIYFFSPYYWRELKVVKVLHNFTKELIKNHEKEFNDDKILEKKSKRLVLLDVLLIAKKEGAIDDKGIQEEVDTFIFAGQDTTTSAFGFLLMLLASHQDVQKKLVSEIVNILGEFNKEPTYNDLGNLQYMEQCIKESLRLYSPISLISRTLKEDVVTKSGYFIPKDTICCIHLYDIHHDPKNFPNPEKFDPDRFLPENIKDRHPFAHVPFSAGPRNCIGQKFAMLEMKAALCAILSNFILKEVDNQSTIKYSQDVVLRSHSGVKVKFLPRNVN